MNYYTDLCGNKIEKRISKRYTFIHIPKTGGTAIEKYFFKYYFPYIRGRGHRNICKSLNNPIVIVREPISRFLSLFHYWKNGSQNGQFVREPEFIEKYKNVDIKSFIQKLQNKASELLHGFTWREHYQQQVCWIDKNYYKNTIIIKYSNDLYDSVCKLFHYLGIENKNIPLEKDNVSKKEEIHLDDEDIKQIQELYKSDFELWNNIEKNPELFRYVI